ncbi:MAG TPA: Gfo/Idh/MocA family oxidoreductase [Micromonosporaceae bacterium]|nr:Gfo/Idh/MocA family oxidoreductase [Micromonosporaceae bacterium]
MSEAPRIALIGAGGHGLWHRRHIAPLHDAGRLSLVALCDVQPIPAADGAPIPPGCGTFTDHREMLRQARPDVVVICTPPPSHLPIAVDVVHAGADLLLEKPPVLSLAEHRALARALAETGRACQVGFQALGSAALAELRQAMVDGRLGTVTGVSAAAAWQRTDGYWTRAPWAGRRGLDGALVNPLAHALMQALAVTDAAGGTLEVERYRVRGIEVEDTGCLRLTLPYGLSIMVAGTLCAEGFLPGDVTVHGTAGPAVLEYPTDRLRLPGQDRAVAVPGRIGLLENLLEHRAAPAAVPLLAPLARTAPFTAVVEALLAAPPPADLDPAFLSRLDGGLVAIRGIDAVVREAADRRMLFSELGVPWAHRPHRTTVGGSP